jgi:hypothetical protein
MEGFGKKRTAPDDDDGALDPALPSSWQSKGKEEADDALVPVKTNMIHVLGEGDTTSVGYIQLDAPEFAPMDADTLRVMICSQVDIVPAGVGLFSHPDRQPLRGPHCLIHGGSTVHLTSIKDKKGEPSFLFYKNMHVEIPAGEDPLDYAHDLLCLVPGSHRIEENAEREQWLVPCAINASNGPTLPPLVLGSHPGTGKYKVFEEAALDTGLPRLPSFVQVTSASSSSSSKMVPLPPMLSADLPEFPRPLGGPRAPKLVKRLPLTGECNNFPDNDAEFECAWATASSEQTGSMSARTLLLERGPRVWTEDEVVIHEDDDDDNEDDGDDEDMHERDRAAWEDTLLYDDDENAYYEYGEDDPADTGADVYAELADDGVELSNNNAPKEAVAWDAIMHMPDGTRLLHGVSVYGCPTPKVLGAICAARGWDVSQYRVLEHGLPIRADMIHGARDYDVRLEHRKG